ncbi:MAG: DNA-processing protein DprA [Clostridia bacterium]|nr:DNA-processing protein DprA [Clostridia bacterium]
MQKDVLFWLWLADLLGAANRDVSTLIELYENPYEIFHADESEIERIPGISPSTRERLLHKDLQNASRLLERCESLGIGILTYGDTAYPYTLREIKDPPVVLYYSGTLPDFQKRLFIGMVGTRRMSAYGMQSAYKISYELAIAGAVVVSGMASGIDGVCAAAALAANQCTVAVLGCGLDVVYPKHHGKLMEAIRQKGVLLTEYPPSTPPNHYHFPVRNRLISGLTQGTMVVEAGLKSGSLITARNAVTQGKPVFTIPANVGSRGAEGTNLLLRDGARLVLSVTDLLEPYKYTHAASLDMERLATVHEKSRVDLSYLDQMGVIEMVRRKDADRQTSVLRAAPEEEKKPAERKRSSRSAASAKEAKAPVKKDLAPEKSASAPLAATSSPKPTPSDVLASLTPIQLAVFQVIPDDQAVTVDALGGLDISYSDMISALTMLEIMGLIQKLPGALYMKV